jgi:hypothetical protein
MDSWYAEIFSDAYTPQQLMPTFTTKMTRIFLFILWNIVEQ